jgi:2-phosphoglycerate kinase
MIQQYKNPVVLSFKANKVLVIVVSSDKELRAIFEKRVVNALEKENVNAVKSIDFFEAEFRSNKQSMEQLNKREIKIVEMESSTKTIWKS